MSDYSYAYGTPEYEEVSKADQFNLIGGTFWPLDNAGLDDPTHFLVSFTSTIEAPYYFWEVTFDESDPSSKMELVAMLETADEHGLGGEGTYRATPVSTINGESHEATVTLSDADASRLGARRRRRRRRRTA